MRLEELVEQDEEFGRDETGHAYRKHPVYGGTDQWRPGQTAFYGEEPGMVVGTALTPDEHDRLWDKHPNLQSYAKQPFEGPYIAWKSDRKGQVFVIPFDPNIPESIPLSTASNVGRSM